jgi:hypothetical protein
VPGTIEVSENDVRLTVEYKLAGMVYQPAVEIPRQCFAPEEVVFSASEYPHRELITCNAKGDVVATTLLATFAHIMPTVRDEAKDLEVVYVGKGLRHSAQDRLESHSTLQRILAEMNSNEPDAEVFALAYSFKYLKNTFLFRGMPFEVSGDAARQRMERAMAFRPSLDQQVALIEASIISYFGPSQYNTHYLDFPKHDHGILKDVFDADFAAIVVQLDNTNIGALRTYSRAAPSKDTHYIVIDFRQLEGKYSFFEGRAVG